MCAKIQKNTRWQKRDEKEKAKKFCLHLVVIWISAANSLGDQHNNNMATEHFPDLIISARNSLKGCMHPLGSDLFADQQTGHGWRELEVRLRATVGKEPNLLFRHASFSFSFQCPLLFLLTSARELSTTFSNGWGERICIHNSFGVGGRKGTIGDAQMDCWQIVHLTVLVVAWQKHGFSYQLIYSNFHKAVYIIVVGWSKEALSFGLHGCYVCF